MPVSATRRILRPTKVCHFRSLSDPPKWYAKPDISLDRWANIQGQINHLNLGKWGGNHRRKQPLWPSLEDVEEDKKVIAYAAGHPDTVGLTEEETQNRLRALDNSNTTYTRNDLQSISWSDAGIDNVLAAVLGASVGEGPTSAQAKVLPHLLNHSTGAAPPGDLLASMPGKSGKTTLFLIGLMHGIRTEDAGLNMMLCSSAQACYNCYNALFGMLDRFQAQTGMDPSGIFGAADRSWILLAPFRDDAETYVSLLMRSKSHPRGPVRIIITTADVWNDMEGKASRGKLNTVSFGYLRRLFVDDAVRQLALPPENASSAESREYDTNPPAVSLALAHIHQRLSAPTRSLLQIALLANDIDTRTKSFFHQLCLNIYNTKEVLTMHQFPPAAQLTTFLYYDEKFVYRFIMNVLQSHAKWEFPLRCVFLTKEDVGFSTKFRKELRSLGMQVKTFSEVVPKGDGCTMVDDWQFLTLRLSEHGLLRHIPDFTHLFLIDTPSDRFELAQIFKTLEQSGMAYRHFEFIQVWPSAAVRALAEILQEVQVRLEDHPVWIQRKKQSVVVNTHRYFEQLDAREVHTRVKPLTKWGLDPQFVVEERYLHQDDPVVSLNAQSKQRESAVMYAEEDYTPIEVQSKRHAKAKKLHGETVKNQAVISAMLERNMINPKTFKPTEKTWDWLHK